MYRARAPAARVRRAHADGRGAPDARDSLPEDISAQQVRLATLTPSATAHLTVVLPRCLSLILMTLLKTVVLPLTRTQSLTLAPMLELMATVACRRRLQDKPATALYQSVGYSIVKQDCILWGLLGQSRRYLMCKAVLPTEDVSRSEDTAAERGFG